MRTMTLATDKDSRHERLLARIGAFCARQLYGFGVWLRRRATEKALHELSDRTLHDIGIDRSEIASIARDARRDRRLRGSGL